MLAARKDHLGNTRTVRALVAEPAGVKTDDNKTPRTRAAGVASFKLTYKNSQRGHTRHLRVHIMCAQSAQTCARNLRKHACAICANTVANLAWRVTQK